MYNYYSSSLTSKGQTTIPAPIRKKLGIKTGEKVMFGYNSNVVVIKTHRQLVEELAGSLKTNIKWGKKKAFEAVGKMLTENYLKTLPRKLRILNDTT